MRTPVEAEASPAISSDACGCDARLRINASVAVSARPPWTPTTSASVSSEGAPALRPSGPAVTDYFDVPVYAAPAGVVFVIDRSGSMNESVRSGVEPNPMGRSFRYESKWTSAREELLQAVGALPSGTRMNAVFFNGSRTPLRQDLAPLDDDTRQQLAGRLFAMRARGRTNMVDALELALQMRPAQVIVLTDGKNNDGPAPVLEVLERYAPQGTRVDTVGFGPAHDRELLEQIAGRSGGVYRVE